MVTAVRTILIACAALIGTGDVAATSLEDGVPVSGHVRVGGVTEYSFSSQRNRNIQVSLTPMSGGDPNIFISQGSTPSSSGWSSASVGADTLVIMASDPKLKQDDSPFHIRVELASNTSANSSYTISAASAAPDQPFEVHLRPGWPTTFEMQGDSWARFPFTVQVDRANETQGVMLTAAVAFGDADLYVNAGAPSSGKWPTVGHSTWESDQEGSDVLVMHADDPQGCKSIATLCQAQTKNESACLCTYYIAVHAFSQPSRVSLTATLLEDVQAVHLQDGMPHQVSTAKFEPYRRPGWSASDKRRACHVWIYRIVPVW